MAQKDGPWYKNDGARDVVDIWNDAIRQYQGIGGKDLKAGYDQFKSLNAMIDFGCKEMESFHGFRYDGTKVAKLRGLFKEGMWLIEGGMQQVNWLTFGQACKEMSADYDVVTTFFVDLTMFLRRMKILEKRLPEQGAFHDCVFDVFASLLRMCATATRYIELKRFKKWVTTLFKGGDQELVAARSGMDTAMNNLHDATEKAILGNTVDLQRSSGETRELLQQMELELQANSEASMKIMEEQFSMMQEMAEKQNTMFNDVKKLLEFEMDRRRNESLPKQSGTKSSGNAKPPTSNSVRLALGYSTDPEKEYQSLRHSLIPETGTWIFEQPEWKAWTEQGEDDDVSPILAVSGPRGTGKSHLAASIYDRLKKDADETTCVVHFYFREDTKDLEEFCNAVNWAVVQIAEQNATLCDRINKEMVREDRRWSIDDSEDVWDNLVKPLFPTSKTPKYQLKIVFDGIDELPVMVQRDELLGCLKKIRDVNISKESNVSVICTLRDARGGENDLLTQLEEIGATSISVTKEKQAPDTKALIWAHLNSDNVLKTFDPYIKQRVATRIEETADCMLYAEHMLRHFSMIGRAPLVLKQLEHSMPKSLEDCYDRILHGLEQKTASSQLGALKSLLAWLSFSGRPLTLADSLQLLRTVFNSSLDLESELQGNQLARVLKIAGREERQSTDTDSGGPTISTDDDPDAKYDDSDLPLKFQGRSMRDYFRQARDATEDLRTPASVAHRKIFLVCCDIICGKIKVQDESLRSYAARNWVHHLSWANITLETNGDSAACLEGLGNIMTNARGAASFFQNHGVDYEEVHSDFVDELPVTDFENDGLISYMAYWASVILNLATSNDFLSQSTVAWAEETIEDRRNAFVPLAKAHIAEWLQVADVESASTSYKFSRSCIALTGQNSLFKKTPGSEEERRYDKEEILGLSRAFGDAPKAANAAWAIAAILEHSRHYDAALRTISDAIDNLTDTTENSESFRTLHLLATVQRNLKDYEAAQDSIARAMSRPDGISADHLRRAYITQAEINTDLGKTDDAIESYEQARQANSTEPLRGEILRKEFDAWNENDKAVDLVKNKWTLQERLEWMTWNYADDREHHTDFLFAAIDANEQDYIVEVYQEIIGLLDHFGAGVPLRNILTNWYAMNGDVDAVRTQCLAVLDSTLNSNNGDLYRFTDEDPAYAMYRALCVLTDTIYEQFRATADRAEKAALFEEAKGLMSRQLVRAVTLQKSWQVHYKVILARMARKLGPLHEFEDILNEGFNATVDALMDDVAWNDEMNLDLLSMVLSSLDGLEREAQIALSARFSDLEPDDEGTAAAEGGDGASTSSGSDDEDEDEDPLPEDEGDLTGYTSYCGGPRCKVTWRAWKGRKMYQCLYCWDTMLWIKNGMVLIEGEEPFAFKDWLVGLKEKKWPEAWNRFWMG
ncbi:hypothetical protein INS49_003452 [Diaporthe citri]|uniref:uncharacterized protein n=1 Tax=Diaporthe citri TaxID=83186 RepID=UPI001C7F4A13|nr:uncharacterized protein INS49_003452 [Diaporthe citri]KAG6355490.1 hypothetical protein INS49_003452 [Diaporthe citri]